MEQRTILKRPRMSILSIINSPEVNRRDFLKLGMAGMLAATVPIVSTSTSQAAKSSGGIWQTKIINAHTGEAFEGTYREGNSYLPQAFEHINNVMRDYRTGEVFPIDPRLFDILNVLQTRSGALAPVKILSGYRSPKTNSFLRHTTAGVAKNSFHMYGQAVDIAISGTSTRRLAGLAQSVRAGGVGTYIKSGFVHVDTGPVRFW